MEGDAGQLGDGPLEAVVAGLALRSASQRYADFVRLQQRLEIRIGIMSPGLNLDRDFSGFRWPLGADEAVDRISAKDLVVIAIDHAAARPVRGGHVDPEKSPQHGFPTSRLQSANNRPSLILHSNAVHECGPPHNWTGFPIPTA